MDRPTLNNNEATNQASIAASHCFHEALRILREADVNFETSDIIELAKIQAMDYNNTSTLAALYAIADALKDIAENLNQ
jgi:hypothetical protein